MSDLKDSPSSFRIRSMCFKWCLMHKNGAFQFHIQKYLSMPGFHLLLPGIKVSTSICFIGNICLQIGFLCLQSDLLFVFLFSIEVSLGILLYCVT